MSDRDSSQAAGPLPPPVRALRNCLVNFTGALILSGGLALIGWAFVEQRWQRNLARLANQAAPLIQAAYWFRGKQGRFPRTVSELVPKHLPAGPKPDAEEWYSWTCSSPDGRSLEVRRRVRLKHFILYRHKAGAGGWFYDRGNGAVIPLPLDIPRPGNWPGEP